MSTAEYAVYIQRPCENWIEKLTVGRGFPKSQKKIDGRGRQTKRNTLVVLSVEDSAVRMRLRYLLYDQQPERKVKRLKIELCF
jgi:hypothetical protein